MAYSPIFLRTKSPLHRKRELTVAHERISCNLSRKRQQLTFNTPRAPARESYSPRGLQTVLLRRSSRLVFQRSLIFILIGNDSWPDIIDYVLEPPRHPSAHETVEIGGHALQAVLVGPEGSHPSFPSLIHTEPMNTPTTARRELNTKVELRDAAIAAFSDFSTNRVLLNDSERLLQIKAGFSAQLFKVARIAFDLHGPSLEMLLNASISTFRRRSREQRPLNSVASERLDRIAVVWNLAEQMFQNRNMAACWMSKPNKALGGNTPVLHCGTEIGGKQVRRVLQALEWGGPA